MMSIKNANVYVLQNVKQQIESTLPGPLLILVPRTLDTWPVAS